MNYKSINRLLLRLLGITKMRERECAMRDTKMRDFFLRDPMSNLRDILSLRDHALKCATTARPV